MSTSSPTDQDITVTDPAIGEDNRAPATLRPSLGYTINIVVVNTFSMLCIKLHTIKYHNGGTQSVGAFKNESPSPK